MAITSTSYSDWIRQNPELVQQAEQRYQQPAPVAQPQVQAAPAQAAPVAQATDSERVPMYGAPQAQPVQNNAPQTQVGSGAQGGDASKPLQEGTEGAKGIAKTIASFYTGGAASGIMGAAGGSTDNRMDSTMEPGARQQGSNGGMGLGDVMGLFSMFKGGGGGGGK